MAFACGSFSLFSLFMLRQELKPFELPQPNEPQFFQRFSESEPGFGFSSYSRFLVLMDCMHGMNRIWREGAVDQSKGAFYKSCHKLSSDVADATPVMGFAWFVKSRSAMGSLDAGTFNTALAMSQLTTPNEQWIAEKRAAAAEDYLGWLSAEGAAAHDKDLTLLAQSRSGSQFLAARYRSDLSFRERITSIVEKLDNGTQRKFLKNVKTVTGS